MLRGFIDESHDGDNPPKVFELSCIVTSDAGCVFFDMEWRALLKSKNEELRKQGRKEISRFHAADFNNYQGDFKDWTPDEQKDFSQPIVRFTAHGDFMPSSSFRTTSDGTPRIVETYPTIG